MADNPNSIVDDATMKKIGEIIKNKAKGLSPSRRIDAALVVEMTTPTKTGQTGVKMTVRGVDFARAMEYGSGTHNVRKFQSKRQTSPTSRILITPKTKKVLAFAWDTADLDNLKGSRINHWMENKKEGILAGENYGMGRQGLPSYIGPSSYDNRHLFNYVHHPGIEAANKGKGYMRLALQESRQEISSLIGEDAMKNLKLKIRAVFSRPGGVNK